MKEAIEKFKALSIGKKIWVSFTIVWFVMTIPVGFSAKLKELPGFLMGLVFFWAFFSFVGFLVWLFFRALVNEAKRSHEKQRIKTELHIQEMQQLQLYKARPQNALRDSIQALPNSAQFRWSTASASNNSHGIERVAIAVDQASGKIALLEYQRSQDKVATRIFQGRDIIEVSVEEQGYVHSETTIENSTTTHMKTSTGSVVGRAIVGGVLLGPAGAIIGGATAKKKAQAKTVGTEKTTQIDIVTAVNLKLLVNDTQRPIFLINFLNEAAAKNTSAYQKATETATQWHGLLSVLKHRAA